MHKLGFTGLKSLDKFKSLTGSASGTAKTLSISSRSSSDSVTTGSFASLKLTAEKLVKEQASVRTDLDLANSKLKKSLEHIHTLEGKLQTAFNENAKLKVKQKEDEKLWKGLESKFSSTKTLCDQLTETLQVLAGQVHEAEKDKQFIEEKLSVNSATIDSLNDQMNNLSLKLESAEKTIRERDKVLEELKIEKEKKEAFSEDQQRNHAKVMEGKEAVIRSLEADVAANKLAGETLKCKLGQAQTELNLKEEDLMKLRVSLENLERENKNLQSSNTEFDGKLTESMQEIQNLRYAVNAFAAELSELDKQSLTISDKITHLSTVYDSCFELTKQETDLSAKCAQKQYYQLHNKYMQIMSEKEELQSMNQGLNNEVSDLQKVQESAMVQHAEECRITEERIRKLESELEATVSKKSEVEKLVTKLEEQVSSLSESTRSYENEKQDLVLQLSILQSENKESTEKLQEDIQKKINETDELQKEIEKHKQLIDSLEKQVSKLESVLEEKEQMILQCKDKEKLLEGQKAEIQALLDATESKLGKAKQQYDAMLDSKQSELSRHLKEISQRNDQAINDIRKKFEIEKQEIITLEKEKADKIVAGMETKCEQRIDQCKEESRLNSARLEEEHTALINRIKEEHEKKESNLKADYREEIRRIQLQAENELREKTTTLRNEHVAQIKALKLQHEDECKQLQEELDLQKTKEEKQRALLQLQWKVMGNKPQEDQEVNSKKDYSVSSLRKRNPNGVKRDLQTQDSPYLAAVQSPVSALLKKVEKVNSGNVMEMSQRSRKVTHHEYEVETSTGGTITKRRKTKSTVMFADPRKRKKTSPKGNTPRITIKGTKTQRYTQPSNIGDLFTEGSLNPYADGDDPYAFD